MHYRAAKTGGTDADTHDFTAATIAMMSGAAISESPDRTIPDQISPCWNVGTLSSAALHVTVVVGFHILDSGTVDTASITLLATDAEDNESVRQVYEAARRAIIRCGKAVQNTTGSQVLEFTPDGIRQAPTMPYLTET